MALDRVRGVEGAFEWRRSVEGEEEPEWEFLAWGRLMMPGMDCEVLFELIGVLLEESRGEAIREDEGLAPARAGFEGVVMMAQWWWWGGVEVRGSWEGLRGCK